MRKFFTVLCFVFFYFSIAFGQAEVDFELLVHDNVGDSYPLWFGLDMTATDDIDPHLGETDLPPLPPAGVFDARMWLPPFNGLLSSWRDYRAPGDPPAFPFTGNKEHLIKFQSINYPVTITWDLPSTIDTSSKIKDPFNLQVKSFSGKDSIVIDLSGINAVEISINYNAISPVGIKLENDLTPSDYKLLQNYPNPFNPTTTIQFQIPQSTNVNLKIYDIVGRRIKTLIDEEIRAGYYSVDWDGLNEAGVSMSSGVYIYRIVTEEFIQTKQMVLLK
jgi:hypothetical protein